MATRPFKFNHVKRLCSACIGLLWITHPCSAITVTYQGKLELQGLYVDRGLLRYADKSWQLEAPSSRFGGKATQHLGDNWLVLAVYEWQINGLDKANQQHRLGSRNTYAGVAHPALGELTFGKNDSRFKRAEGKIDRFNETLADMAQLTAGQDRLENVFSYQAPRWHGVQMAATWQSGVSDEVAGGYDTSLSYGDSELTQQPYYLAYARVHKLNNISAHRFVLHHTLGESIYGHWSSGLLWQHTRHQTKPLAGHGYLTQLALQRQEWTYKLQAQWDNSRLRHNSLGRAVHVGVDYAHTHDITWYTLASYVDFAGTHDSAAAVGFRWNFKL